MLAQLRHFNGIFKIAHFFLLFWQLQVVDCLVIIELLTEIAVPYFLQGFTPAITALGWYYEQFEKNYERAAELWEQADLLENPEAAMNLGVLYLQGLYPGQPADKVCAEADISIYRYGQNTQALLYFFPKMHHFYQKLVAITNALGFTGFCFCLFALEQHKISKGKKLNLISFHTELQNGLNYWHPNFDSSHLWKL